MSTGRSDSDLIQAAMAGDGGAFADLVRPEYRTAVRLAYALLHDQDDAEDAVQEASLRAWRKLRNVKPGAPLKPWYLAIVANQCRSVRRAKSWSTRSDEPLPEQEVSAAAPGTVQAMRKDALQYVSDMQPMLAAFDQVSPGVHHV